MNRQLLTSAVQDFIRQHPGSDLTRLVLGKSPFPGVSTRELAEQIDGKVRCEKKLPTWFRTPGIYYPPKLAIEQASSELTAQYKSTLAHGPVTDITGGFGVDAHFFAERSPSVTHLEINQELSEVAAYNSTILGRPITFIPGDGMHYLRTTDRSTDTIYVDPSRRVATQKVFLLRDCEPDVVGQADFLLQKASRVLIKTSPLLDLTSGLRELRHVSEIHVISIKNDCKELIWVLDRDAIGEPVIISVALDTTCPPVRFTLEEERSHPEPRYAEPRLYLYEPDAALLKAGCFKLITSKFQVEKLHRHSHLYTSDQPVKTFMGRRFRITGVEDYHDFLRRPFAEPMLIISRNFPLSVAELRKRHRIEDGGDRFLVFTRTPGDRLVVISCEKETADEH